MMIVDSLTLESLVAVVVCANEGSLIAVNISLVKGQAVGDSKGLAAVLKER